MPIDKLIAGYYRFREGYFEKNRQSLAELAHIGQSPKVAVIACCDSRVDPSVITDSTPGDLFVIRNVANLVPPCEGEGAWHGTSAALEFAVCGLDVEDIIILSHARYRGIRSLLQDEKNSDKDKFISSWMSIVDEARQQASIENKFQTLDERAHACELDAIKISLRNLLTFPWIRERVEKNNLQLHGWYYDMMSGDVLRFDESENDYISL